MDDLISTNAIIENEINNPAPETTKTEMKGFKDSII